MCIWQDGDRDKPNCVPQGPSIVIPLCTPGAPWNTATLNLDCQMQVEEILDVDSGK